MEPIKVSLYFIKSKTSKTMNLNNLAEVLRTWGWKDGEAYAIVNEEDKTFTITNSLIRSAPLLMKIRNAEGEIQILVVQPSEPSMTEADEVIMLDPGGLRSAAFIVAETEAPRKG